MEDRKYKHWVFTWNQDLSFIELSLLDKFLKSFCDSFVHQKEMGEETNRVHEQGYFCSKTRKRHPQLIKMFASFCEIHNKLGQGTNLNVDQFTVQRMMGTKEEAIAYCTKTETRITRPKIYGLPNPYEASDLRIFDDSSNWYPWQVSFMKLILNKDLTISDPDDRTIIWIQDLKGNSGKSKLVKHVCFNNPVEACKLSFGSSTQLRSACISAGPKKLYFIDVPRTLGKEDDINDIISVIEDIKNGFVVSSMYGKHLQLMFDPPHIVVFANIFCPKNALSSDRLQEYSIEYSIEKEFIKILKRVN